MCITTTENSKVGGGGILFNCTEFLQKSIDFFFMHGYGRGGGGGGGGGEGGAHAPIS